MRKEAIRQANAVVTNFVQRETDQAVQKLKDDVTGMEPLTPDEQHHWLTRASSWVSWISKDTETITVKDGEVLKIKKLK